MYQSFNLHGFNYHVIVDCSHGLKESFHPTINIHSLFPLLQLIHSQLSLIKRHFQGSIQGVRYVLKLIWIDLGIIKLSS